MAGQIAGVAGDLRDRGVPLVRSTGVFRGTRVRTDDAAVPRWLPWALRILALGIGALHTGVAVARQSMNEDGINYLDMGAAYMAGDWETAINAIWSPLYSWIIGAVIYAARPTIWWEFPVVQVTNGVVFVMTLVCFEFFWRQLTASYYRQPETAGTVRFAPAVWLILGYSLFIWSSLNLIAIWAVTPDMLVAAFVYLAGGLMLRMCRSDAPHATVALLGVVLGLAFLAKAALFPLGIVCILLAASVKTASMGRAQRMAWALVPFALAAGPFLAALSLASGHFTFGEVGRFTYLKHVNELRYPHWDESLERVAGRPDHGPRRVFERPDVYEFAEPIRGTYPLSFDPGYWTSGLSPRVDMDQQLRALVSNARVYFELFMRTQGGIVAIVLLLSLVVLLAGRRPKAFGPEAALVVWALCAFGLYALVYVTPRYVAPFVLIFWSGLLASVRFPEHPAYGRLANASGIVLALIVWINIGAFNLEGAGSLFGVSAGSAAHAVPVGLAGRFSDGSTDSHPEIADGLQRLGLRQGDRVGFIGESFTAFWARLARVRIVAEIPPQHAREFWSADPDRRSDALGTFADAGAVAVVADTVPEALVARGWQTIGDTGYAVYFLRLEEHR